MIPPSKYTDEQMHQAFDLVKNKEHWKNPVRATVNVDEKFLDIIFEAVIYFTGSVPEIYKVKKGYRVEAEGYYNAIGA